MQCIAPWIPPFNAGLRSDEEEKFTPFWLSTVDANNKPHVRTCVYRGFLFDDQSTNSIVFTSDKRAKKIEEITSNCAVEACFYFRGSGKQFRFSGKACSIIPSHGIYPSVGLPDLGERRDDEEEDEDDEDDNNSSNGFLHKTSSTASVFQHSSKDSTKLIYPLFSPKSLELVKRESESAKSFSFSDTLKAKPEMIFAPTNQDYCEEYSRVWNSLSKRSKSSFKLPKPRSVINEEKRKQIDRISRGVDGKNIEDGRAECAVVVLFIDRVDYYKDSYGDSKRMIYERVNFDQWREIEVVP